MKKSKSSKLILKNYRIVKLLGKGGIGSTYAAENLKDGERVALKAISLRGIDDFKILELFEREVRILAQLNHPNIPRYIDYFQIDTPHNRFFCLVQQLAEGQSLDVLLEKGWQPNETEAQKITVQLLETLVYLQQLTPPVIHRDIKPQNIILNQDGKVFLVDFGAVQDVYHNTLTAGSTVAGTYGYMAPEQFRGQATLATDLYALGSTLICLLTRKDPTDLPHRKLKIDFRSHLRVSKRFANWLDQMIEPMIEDRFLSAEEALAVLQGKKEFTRSAMMKLYRPANSPIILVKDEKKLVIKIPPVGLRSDCSRIFAMIPLVWNGILLLMIWTISALSGYVVTRTGWYFVGAYGLLGIGMLGTFLLTAFSRTKLEINRNNFQLQRWFFGLRYYKVDRQTQDISQLELKEIGLSMKKTPITVITLNSRLRHYRFGSFLTEPEKEWLVAEVNKWLSHTLE